MAIEPSDTICQEMRDRIRWHRTQYGLNVDQWPLKGVPVTLDEWYLLSERVAYEEALKNGVAWWPNPLWQFDSVRLRLASAVVTMASGRVMVRK